VSSKSSSKQSLWKEQQNLQTQQTHRGKWGGLVSSKSSSKQSLWKEQQNLQTQQTHGGKWGGRGREGVIVGSWQSGCLVFMAIKKAEETRIILL
jgi:hypothetical protein